jgi:hypothetical protein
VRPGCAIRKDRWRQVARSAHTTADFCVIACVLRAGLSARVTPSPFFRRRSPKPQKSKALKPWRVNERPGKSRHLLGFLVVTECQSGATAACAFRLSLRTKSRLVRAHVKRMRLTQRCHQTVGERVLSCSGNSAHSSSADIRAVPLRLPVAKWQVARPMPHADYLSYAPFAFKTGAKLVTKPWFLAGSGQDGVGGIRDRLSAGSVRARLRLVCPLLAVFASRCAGRRRTWHT